MISNTESLLDPAQPGVLRIPRFMGSTALASIKAELADSAHGQWRDQHVELPPNARGVSVTQNFHAFALKLSRGNLRRLYDFPYIMGAVRTIEDSVTDMARSIRPLRNWHPDEVSLHQYDTQDVGISYHKDNQRFWGVIAILALDGVCDTAVRHNGKEHLYATEPGDLIFLRAPGLVQSDEDLRPEHAIVNLQTATRTSLMVRANDRPDELLPGFAFANWSGA